MRKGKNKKKVKTYPDKMKKQIKLFFYVFMVLITVWNCHELCNVDKMKRVFNYCIARNSLER